MASAVAVADTFPKLLAAHARERGESPAIREKDLGIWQSWKWREVAEEVRLLAAGLAARGITRGKHVAVIGDNRPRLYFAQLATQALGGIPVPFYQDAPAPEMTYVFQNAEIEIAIVEDQEQADKLFEILPQCPKLRHIFYDDPRGFRHYKRDELASYDSLRAEGEAWAKDHPDFVEQSDRAGQADRTPRSCSTPRARRACPRAWCSPTTTSSSRAAPTPSSRGCATTRRSSRTCPWPGSARTSSPTRSGW